MNIVTLQQGNGHSLSLQALKLIWWICACAQNFIRFSLKLAKLVHNFKICQLEENIQAK